MNFKLSSLKSLPVNSMSVGTLPFKALTVAGTSATGALLPVTTTCGTFSLINTACLPATCSNTSSTWMVECSSAIHRYTRSKDGFVIRSSTNPLSAVEKSDGANPTG